MNSLNQDFGDPQTAHREFKRLIDPILDHYRRSGALEHAIEIHDGIRMYSLVYNSFEEFVNNYPTNKDRTELIKSLQEEAVQNARGFEHFEALIDHFFDFPDADASEDF